MQKKGNVEDNKDVTLRIMETAMAEELKAKNLYKKISSQLENKAAKLKFVVMSDAEQRHYEQLRKWYEFHFGKSPEDIINIIIKAETNACIFYENAAKKTKDNNAKKVFEALISMERGHVTQFKDELRVISEPSLWCAEEDIPWMLEV